MLLGNLFLELLSLVSGLSFGLVTVRSVDVGLVGSLVGLVGHSAFELVLLLRERSVGVSRVGNVGEVGLGLGLGLLFTARSLVCLVRSFLLGLFLGLLGFVVDFAGGRGLTIGGGDPNMVSQTW